MANNGISPIRLSTLDMEGSLEGLIRQAHWNRSAKLEGTPTLDSEEGAIRTFDAACGFGPKIRAAADEIERGRRLPTANQHVLVSRSMTWEVPGRVLLGLEHNYGLLF